ncbi:MAG: hypothetical protein WCJ94_05685 [bacterium]
MGRKKGFVSSQVSVSTRKTVTRTIVVPKRGENEDIYAYYLKLKKLGLKLPTKKPEDK